MSRELAWLVLIAVCMFLVVAVATIASLAVVNDYRSRHRR